MVTGQLLNLVAPARCVECLLEGSWWCRQCAQRRVLPPLVCPVCKQERARGLTCVSCKVHTPLTGLITAGSYASPALRRGIHWLKFKGVRPLADLLAALIISRLSAAAHLSQLPTQAVLVPIPLHWWRLRQRGFNQSEDIAQAISRITAIPVAPLLQRQRATWTQAQLPSTKSADTLRWKNLSGAFTVTEKATEIDFAPIREVLLVDDVTTSGATFTAAAQALRPIVPQTTKLWGVAVARG